MPKSLRKHIRLEKARIRREVFDTNEQNKLISELYSKVLKKPAAEAKPEAQAEKAKAVKEAKPAEAKAKAKRAKAK